MVMEILLLLALIAVAAATLYVSFTLNIRAKQNIVPLVDGATGTIAGKIETASSELKQQVETIAEQLQRDSKLVKQIEATSKGLIEQVQGITFEVRQDAGLVKHLGEHIGTQQNRFSQDLLQLDRRVAQLSESLAQQGAQVAEIHGSIRRREKQAEGSPDIDSLVLAMLEAESQSETKGWGKPPQLYVLTAERQNGRSQALIPVEREPLPDGNLIEALASIHWPEDVVGCVLVTELAALPLSDLKDAFVDPVAAGQWASTHPDGRPARLAIGVRRNGEHTYGLRIKGEDDVQVRADLAEDLVTALRRTF
jgi:hypothetical protein